MQQEFREVEFRYGFSFPWMMLPERVQRVIDELEAALEAGDLEEVFHRMELQSCIEVYYQRIGYVIVDELAERYDLAIPQYWH